MNTAIRYAALACLLGGIGSTGALAGGVEEYMPGPGITAGIFLSNDTVPIPGEVDAWLTDGIDGYGWASDVDLMYWDGSPYRYVPDGIDHVIWSVPVGTLLLPGASTGSAELTTNDQASKFKVRWAIPTGSQPGTYAITAKVFDEGRWGSESRDSTPASPCIRTKTIIVGTVTYSSDPPIAAGIGVQLVSVGNDRTRHYQLTATDGATGAVMDQDSKFIEGVFAGHVPDTIDSVEWHVTDDQGVPLGTLGSPTGTQTTWSLESSRAEAYITMTVKDRASNGPAYQDRARTVMGAIIIGGGWNPRQMQLDEAGAIAAARAFCSSAAVNAPEPADEYAEAHFPALVDYDGAQPTYYAPRWDVKFESGTEVQVVDSTTPVIARYTNFKATGDLLASQAPPTPTLGLIDARDAAAAVRMASGSSDTIGAPTVTHGQMTDSLAAGQICTVVYGRSFNDPYNGSIPYRDQAVRVMLQDKDKALLNPGQTPALLGYSLTLPSHEPMPATREYTCSNPPLSSDDCQAALDTAASTLPTGYVPVGTPAATLMVVQPNTFWTDGNSEPNGDAPVIAWVCVFTDADGTTYEVWEDAGSVTVVGGNTSGIARSMRRRTAAAKPAPPSDKSSAKPKMKAAPGKKATMKKHTTATPRRRAHR